MSSVEKATAASGTGYDQISTAANCARPRRRARPSGPAPAPTDPSPRRARRTGGRSGSPRPWRARCPTGRRGPRGSGKRSGRDSPWLRFGRIPLGEAVGVRRSLGARYRRCRLGRIALSARGRADDDGPDRSGPVLAGPLNPLSLLLQEEGGVGDRRHGIELDLEVREAVAVAVDSSTPGSPAAAGPWKRSWPPLPVKAPVPRKVKAWSLAWTRLASIPRRSIRSPSASSKSVMMSWLAWTERPRAL
jgi:hypothetical protein